MNYGTVQLGRLLDSFKKMSVAEYLGLYDRATRNLKEMVVIDNDSLSVTFSRGILVSQSMDYDTDPQSADLAYVDEIKLDVPWLPKAA